MAFEIIIAVISSLVLILIIVVGITASKTNRKNLNKLKENGFEPDCEIMGLMFDTKHGLWCRKGMDTLLKSSEITDCEILEDGISYKSDNGVIRAVIGGALFGEIGAVVGAMTSTVSEQVSKMDVCIYTSNPLLPKMVVNLIALPVSKSSVSYKSAKSNAESIINSIDKLSGFSSKNKSITNTSAAGISADSSADELAKYKKLLDDGAITQDEYDKVKQKLLNI